jgi:DNA-binding XRE family transcriptional regulator
MGRILQPITRTSIYDVDPLWLSPKMIAAQCRAARGLLNMTVKELAARARVAPDTIVRLENGRELKPCTLKAIRKALEAAGVEFLPAGVRFNCGPMCGWGPIR